MLTRLGRVASRRPRLVLAVWAAVFVLGLVAGPVLFATLAIGLVLSIVQSATQIQVLLRWSS